MPLPTTSTAKLMCPFGTTPSTLTVPPTKQIAAEAPLATIQDNVPNLNIPPFGMCLTPTNPQVAAATSAALGVLTPQPCLLVIPAPWAPGSPKVKVCGVPALTQESTCACSWGGVITITHPGTTKLKG